MELDAAELPGYSFFSAKRSYAIQSAQTCREAALDRSKGGGSDDFKGATKAKKCIAEILPGMLSIDGASLVFHQMLCGLGLLKLGQLHM